MRYFIRNTVLALLCTVLAGTGIAHAQSSGYQFQNNGIFGCSNIGGASVSSGTFASIGGVFVPVNDAAVTLNSGILDYLQCVLRPLVSRLRESATSDFTKRGIVGFLTGREGNPLWPVDLNADIVARSDEAAYQQLINLDAVNPAFRNQVRTAVVRGYMAETRTNSQLGCDYNGDLQADITDPTNRPFSFENFQKLANPACNPLGAALLTRSAVERNVGNEVGQMLFKLQSGGGVYGVEQTDADGNHITVTPGSLVGGNINQLVQSGFTQLENANDIGQMISSLYAGLSTQVIYDAQGLNGLVQSQNGTPSYLDRVSNAATRGVLSATANAALQILNAARQNELKYLSAVNAIATSLTQAINQLRATENRCWDLIAYQDDGHPEQHTCVTAPLVAATSTCMGTTTVITLPSGATTTQTLQLEIATSTTESQRVINSQIAPLASSTITEIRTSQAALQRIDSLIAQVNNASSSSQQNAALQQLDQLVANNQLHTQYDAQDAAQRQSDTQSAMTKLVRDTASLWGDNNDPNVGWCNIRNTGVIQRWTNAWKI